jgi:hypothetical protein
MVQRLDAERDASPPTPPATRCILVPRGRGAPRARRPLKREVRA